MANIKGIIVEIGGDTSKLQNALKKVNSSTASLSKELKGINSLLKLDPKNTEMLSQKQTVLKQNIEQTSKKLEELKNAQEMADNTIANGGKISQENYRNLQREILVTENKLNNLKAEASNWTKAGRSIEEFGNKITNISNKIDKMGTTLTTRLTLPIAGIATLLTKSAMEQETAVQQIDNIYGEASETIKSFAENTALSYNMSTKEAYKYSQVFGNLIQSITDDQKENAQYTQELLKASSVIASSTGRTMEDVMDRIRSGLLGNTEAIEDLGVNVNVALLESTDAFKKFAGDKSWNQLDFQTQQQIRLFGILEQTTKKYGDEINENTSSSLQKVTAKFNNLTSKLGKNLLPIANRLLDVAEKGIDKLEDLSDEEEETITNTALFVASIGPAIKIVGTLGKTLGNGIKTVGSFSQAVGLMGKTSTEAFKNASAGTQSLAKGLTFLTSPAGLATAAITLTAGALVYFAAKQTEAQKKAKELAEEMANSKQSLEEYNQNIDKTTSANLAQIDSVSKLKDELATLVDENGKVKKGYESRVNFILNQLNEALGTEYSLNGDIVQSYKDLQNEIDSTIEKKKAQIKLNAEEEKYKNAIENQKEAVEGLKTAQENLGTSIEEAKQKYQNYTDTVSEAQKNMDQEAQTNLLLQSNEMDALKEKISAYEDAEWQVKEYTNNVKEYEEDYAKFTEGKYSEIGNTIKASTEDWTTKALEEINKSIGEQCNAMQQYKQIYKNTGSQIALQLSQQAQQNLDSLTQELARRTQTLAELGPQEIEAWKKVASESYSSYSEEIAKIPPDMQQKIQEATGVIAGGTPQMQAKAEELGRKTVEEFDKSADAKSKALNTITGYLSGLNDEEKKELLKQAGIENVDIVLDELNKGNLSEENGRNILEGLWRGLKNNTWQGKILGVASGLAQAVNKAFTGKDGWDEHSPSKKMKKFAEYYIQPISDVMNARKKGIVSTAQGLASKINDVFNGQMNMPQINDFGKLQGSLKNQIVDSTKTVFTTPQIVFNVQELDEAKLNQCFNYINKKFGSAY